MADAKEDEGTRVEENGETGAPLERSMSIQERRAVFEKKMNEDGTYPTKHDHNSDEDHKSITPPPHHGRNKGEPVLQHSATFDLSDVSDDESKEVCEGKTSIRGRMKEDGRGVGKGENGECK